MKIISMYLPQFHRVKENDKWWGEGFTEWVSVKTATPIYEGHIQPRIPLNNNYYNLLEKNTMEWQADLMHTYGVDAMCFYHYWFKDGRQILEKPAENLLKWTDINMPFCFCWANEAWARSWSKISSKNLWASVFEVRDDERDNGVLLEQKYGEIEAWKAHFEYLLPFFKDERYIKVDNKPVFLIYKISQIACLEDMIEKWNFWAKKSGFNGIYLIGANTNIVSEKIVTKILYHEPQHSNAKVWSRDDKREHLISTKYSDVWEEILKNTRKNADVIYGGFVGYDDTPRRGKEGRVIEGQTPELFKEYLTELLAKNEVANSPFTFVNAWNEWGEGMYLEPDEKEGYAYLEAIPYAKENYKKYLQKYKDLNNRLVMSEMDEYNVLAEKCARYEGYWRVLDKWLSNKEDNILMEEYLLSRGIDTVAIYGGGMLGKHLLEELKYGNVKVICVIDRKADALQLRVPVHSPDDTIPNVDAIIVTATYAYAHIKKQLEKKGYRNIYSLETIVSEM